MGSPENKRKRHFNPRSPHGERREDLSTFDIYSRISIHAPRTGSDFQHLCGFARLCAFQSTLPARGATRRYRAASYSARFQSTLPARGATAIQRCNVNDPNYFNPRSPHGERRRVAAARTAAHIFQSTLPARGATGLQVPWHRRCNISIHAPRTGSDKVAVLGERADTRNFNPRSPHGERHFRHALQADQRYFNPRSPHGERRL